MKRQKKVSLSSPQISFHKISLRTFRSKAMVNISRENYLIALLACAANPQLGGEGDIAHLQGDSDLLLSGRLQSGALADLCLAWQQRCV